MNGVTSLVVASVGGPVCFTWCVGFLTLLCPLCCDVICGSGDKFSFDHPPTQRRVELVVALRLLPEGSSVHWV